MLLSELPLKQDRLVENKQFRSDLYNVFPIHLPPLREHRDDIIEPALFFVQEFSKTFGRKAPVLAEAALTQPKNHVCSGNVRKPRNVIEQAMILCMGLCWPKCMH